MGKFAYAQNNFSSGELSPKLEGRSDIKEYYNGLASMENFIPMREGGATLRPPTEFLRNVTSDIAGDGALYPFVVSSSEAYLLCINTDNATRMELYRTTVGTYGASLTQATLAVSASVKANLANLDNHGFRYVQVNNWMILTHESGTMPPLLLIRTFQDRFAIFQYHAYASTYLGTAALSTAGLVLSYAFPPEDTYSLSTMTVTSAGTINIQCSVAGVFQSGHTGALLRINNSGNESVYYLGGDDVAANNQFTDCTLVAGGSLIGLGAFSKFTLCSWNDADGWPKAVSMYQQRLIFAGTASQPNTVWCSTVENLFIMLNRKLAQDALSDGSNLDYFGSVADSDAFDIRIASDRSNEIKWMSSDRVLQLGTAVGEYVVSTAEGIFGPSNVSVLPQTFFGSNKVEAVRAHNSTVFIGSDGKTVREIGFSEEKGSNVSRLLTALSDQIVYHGHDETTSSLHTHEIVAMAWQGCRSILWLVTTTGNLLGVTIEPSSGVLAWHKHTIGGTAVKITGICVVPDTNKKFDNVYLNIQRTVNSATVNYIERMGENLATDLLFGRYNTDNVNYLHHSDSSFIPSVQTLGSNKWDVGHLQGETVEVVCKGVSEGQKTVLESGGTAYVEVTNAAAAAGNIIVGLPFKGTLKSMILEAGSRIGNAAIQLKQLDRMIIKVLRGYKFKIGTTSSNLESVDLSVSGSPLNLYTGNSKPISPNSTPEEDQRFYLESDGPYPLSVLSIAIRGSTED